MKFRSFFLVSAYLVVIFSALALLVGSSNFLFFFLAMTLLGAGSLVPFPLNRRSSNMVIAFAFLILVLISYAYYLDFIFTLAQFLLIVQIFRLFLLREEYDEAYGEDSPRPEHFQIYYIALVQFAVAAISTVNFGFALLFTGFLLVSPLILITFSLRGEVYRRGMTIEKIPFRSLLWPMFSVGIILGLLVPFLFLFLPRVPQGMLGSSNFKKTQITGFSEEVDLDDLGYILQNPQVVMRVKLLDRRPRGMRFLFKGTAYEVYKNRQWKQFQTSGRIKASKNDVFQFKTPPPGVEKVRQQIFLNPLNTHTLFALRPLESLKFLGDSTPRYLSSRSNGWIRVRRPPRKPIGYIATSYYRNLSLAERENLKFGAASHMARRVPGEIDGQRLSDLARKIIREAGAENPYDQVLAIEQHLREEYKYTLNLSESGPTDPVENFLFETKKGHCELFASAMIFLLRSQGIPARLVNGFQEGKYNPMGKYYLIRQKDAHAWVEVKFEDAGWMAFDPTSPRLDEEGESLWTQARQFFDYLQHLWIMQIVQYDSTEQNRIKKVVKKWASQLAGTLQRWWYKAKNLSWWEFLLFIVLPAFAGAFSIYLLYHLWAKWRRRRRGYTLSSQSLRELVQILNKRGYRLLKEETMREFVRRATEAKPFNREALEIVDIYYKDRFSNRSLEKLEEERIQKNMKKIKGAFE